MKTTLTLPQETLTGLASHFVSDGLLSFEMAEQASLAAKQQHQSLITYLVKNHLLSSDQILQSCVKQFALPVFDLNHYELSWLKNLTLSAEWIRRYHVIPLQKHSTSLDIGLSDPTDRMTLDTLAFHTGLRINPFLILENQLNDFIEKNYTTDPIHHLELNLIEHLPDEKQLKVEENIVNYDEPLIRFVDDLILHALAQAASDIHIEPYEHRCRIRYRQDGILYEITEVPHHLASRLTTRLKVMAKLDIAERRLPQDGRFQLHERDIRISTCPTHFGEKVVLRLLNANKMILNLTHLGMSATQEKLLIETISQAQGMILVTGPTGSGKTVTLYSALHFLNNAQKNISTVEDPIEIQLAGINQVNIHPKIGLEFATVLRTLLRQDPDIIMVGEIRDTETADIAIQAAQTGHLVFSTLHTNSAIEALTRLQSMGIAPFNLISSLSLIIAQRLLRKLCEQCKQVSALPIALLQQLNISFEQHATFFDAKGCQHCLNGYKGRIGIYEFLPLTDPVKEFVVSRNFPAMTHYLQQAGFASLKQSAFEKVLAGLTTLSEMSRVLQKC